MSHIIYSFARWKKNKIIYGLWDEYVSGTFNTFQLWENLVAKLKDNLDADYSKLDDDNYCSDPHDYLDMDLQDPIY